MTKISVITVTAREESETWHKNWMELTSDIRSGRTSKYRPMSLIREPFHSLLLECVKPQQESFLEPTLESLKLQTFRDFEVIIVDHFADERRRITNRYKGELDVTHVREKPTIWHTLPEPKGFETPLRMKFPCVCNARNTGIILAEGELLVFLDDNILLQPKTLETCWRWHEKGCDLKIIRHRFNFDEARDYILFDPEFKGGSQFGKVFEEGTQLYDYRGAWTNAVAFPLETELAVNGFNEDLDGVQGCDDIEHAIRLSNYVAKHGGRMMLDRNAVAWELGHYHIQYRRYNVRANFVLLDAMVEKWGSDLGGRVRANDDRSYLPELMKRYAELHEARRERDNLEYPIHPYFAYNVRVPSFELKELRRKHRSGEFKW